MRQASIAVMTRSCAVLMCLAWAVRHAAPWRRKMSATSRFGRDTAGQAGIGPANLRCSSGLWTCRIVLSATRAYRAVEVIWQ